MGLDITAYRKLQKLDVVFDADGEPIDPTTREPLDYSSYVKVHINPNFPGRADGLEDRGVYSYDESMWFRAGSYGGYNAWRRDLAALAGYTDRQAWDGMCEGKPFAELVNFSDCEGVIGASVAAKLAADFRDFRARAEEFGGEVGWFYENYEKWMQAMEMAADGGCVDFH